MLVADLAQALQIALRRDQRAGRSRDRLDEYGGDGRPAIGRAVAFQIVRQFHAVLLGLTVAEQFLARPGVADRDHVRQRDREGLAVLDHAGQRDAAHVHAVIGALPRYEAQALALAIGAVVGHHHFQRGINAFGTGVREEHVVHRFGQQGCDLAGQLE